MGLGVSSHPQVHVSGPPARSPAAGTWYARWIVTRREPTSQRQVHPPRRAIAHVELYDGSRADVPVHIVAVGPGVVGVRQQVAHHSSPWWVAWVSRTEVDPID